ncbi:MAG TPA: potassium-transporting ATPase subunit KdpA [Holophaga sp.]|nr:potassium-transporting ATPase subunit KdpA [Holophaga sp.]
MSPLFLLLVTGLILALALLAPPLGGYLGRTLDGEPLPLDRVLLPLERALFRILGVGPGDRMDWKGYLGALLAFNALGFAFLLALLRLQGHLPLNPMGFKGMAWPLAFNTAASFVTNTDWQAYAGEAALGPLAQALGLTVQNFLSAATGLAVMAAVARGIRRRKATSLGSFWVDLVRVTLRVLLPLSLLFALFLVSQGVVQTWVPALHAAWVAPPPPGAPAEQLIPLGPAASQLAIKMLGTNGGGFFGANAMHPFENPTALANLAQILAILLLPAACCFAFGRMVRDRRQGWAIFGAMALLLLLPTLLAGWAEARTPAALRAPAVVQVQGSLEGKEARVGVEASTLWSTATTAASNGAVNAQHDAMAPLSGLAQMVLMQIGEVAFGGVGSGLYGMLVFVVVAVFVSGLMVGRTPEYLGKKVEAFEMKMAALVVLVPSALILGGAAATLLHPDAGRWISAPGPHGFTQVLYAWTSAAANNGSAFNGLTADVPFLDWGLGLAMLAGRFAPVAAVLAMAGSLAAKKRTPPGPGTLPTHSPFFAGLLVAVVLLVGALTFLPALAVGPLAEHLAPLGKVIP